MINNIKNRKVKITSITVGALLLIVVGFFIFIQSPVATASSPRKAAVVKPRLIVAGINTPSYPMFAEEAVKISDYEVAERLDKELLVNTYMHASTMLYIKLSSRWFPVIEPILKNNGIPDDFKYLCVAESGLQPVVSPSKAEGLWQFLAETGRQYDLEINDEVDERYNVELATQAACDYFNESYARFGNWTLVAASYNMGQGGLSRKMSDQGQSNYYELLLSKETMRYILRIVALKEIMQNPTLHGFSLDANDYYAPLNYYTDFVNTPINWVSYAAQKGLSYKDIRLMNPWINSDKMTNIKKKTYQIKIPN